jgi:hypothetical protein
MWDLASMSISYKPPTFYVSYLSSQYGTGVLQLGDVFLKRINWKRE